MKNTKDKDFGLSTRVTRGDGITGEDITFNAYKFKNLLPSLDLNKFNNNLTNQLEKEINKEFRRSND